MADTATTTLRHVLTQPKPCVPCKTGPIRNTKSARWPSIKSDTESDTITVWKDFNLDILNESYGHILDQDVLTAELADAPHAKTFLDSVRIVEPDDIRYLIDWNNRMLGPTLKFAKERLGLHRGAPLRLTMTARDKSSIARVTNSQRTVKVDHRIEMCCYPLPDLVVGLGRPSSKFPARQVADKPEFANHEVLWPLRQLANMCETAGTRYGYIMTEEDFVACCFHKAEAEPAGPARRKDGSLAMKVALMPVPWEQHGEEQLTTDLALWWMSMLALSDSRHRALVLKADMVGIGEWEPAFLDEERGWVRRHRYSKFEERTGQPPPPAYQAPSPGNQAAFEVSIGINMDLDFNLYDDSFGIHGHVDGAGLVDGPFFGHPDPVDEFVGAGDIADVYAANSRWEGDA
ncbi:hypothetical protein V8C35DRAFT_315468 [Trichoderma chlorosporum]